MCQRIDVLAGGLDPVFPIEEQYRLELLDAEYSYRTLSGQGGF
jgi:hypothetical protein